MEVVRSRRFISLRPPRPQPASSDANDMATAMTDTASASRAVAASRLRISASTTERATASLLRTWGKRCSSKSESRFASSGVNSCKPLRSLTLRVPRMSQGLHQRLNLGMSMIRRVAPTITFMAHFLPGLISEMQLLISRRAPNQHSIAARSLRA